MMNEQIFSSLAVFETSIVTNTTMSTRAPSYYHWSQDKPCTTNQTYGFAFRDTVVDPPPGQKRKTHELTRPFSNSAFFPTISSESSLTAPSRSRPLASLRPCREFCPPGIKNKFDINKGYVMGPVPVTQKIRRSDVPVGVALSRSITAPPAFCPQPPKGKDTYLWHTVLGSLVHCKNFPPSHSAIAERA